VAVTKKSVQGAGDLEAAADTSKPSGNREQRGESASYMYTGGLNAVVVVVGGTAYDFRLGEPVHLPHAEEGLDSHPDFKRVAATAAPKDSKE
jgi:hypothetical protein